MTLLEAKDILKTRIGFRDDNTVANFTLSAENAQTDSGMVFQSEHSAVTLQNIRDCQPVARITEADFNTYLEDLKEQCVLQVLSDTFERGRMDDNLLTQYPGAFDTAIKLRMVVVVGELIMTSTRSNNIERLTDSFIGKLNYDIFRDTVQKFANNNAAYNYSMGIASRYMFEVKSLQRRFGNQRNMLKTITRAEVTTTHVPESDTYENPFKL